MPVSYTPLSGSDTPLTLSSLNTRYQSIEDYFLALVAAGASQRTLEATAGEGLADRAPAYLDLSDGQIYQMDADAAGPKAGTIRGFVDGVTLSGATATLVVGGFMDGFTGLTALQQVYVGTTAGSTTQTRPSPTSGGSQVMIAPMGLAVSTTEVIVAPDKIQYQKRDAMADTDTLTIQHHSDSEGYLRDVWAYITDTAAGVEATGYSDSNQDSEVNLQYNEGSDNLDVNESGTQLSIGKGGGGAVLVVAQSFQLTSGGILDTIKFTLLANQGSPTGNITWRIRENNAGEPGTELASAVMTPTPSSENTINVTGADRVRLSASTTYWLTLEADDASGFANTTSYSWDSNSSGAYANGNAGFFSDGVWNNLAAYDNEFAIVTVEPKTKLSQTFTLGSETDIASVGLWLKKGGSPTGTVTVRIETVSGGEPTGTLADAAASVTFVESTLTTSFAEKLLLFASEFTLSAGTYALVISTDRAASASNYIIWGADGSAPSYAGGEMFSEKASAWSAESKDAVFSVYEPGIENPGRVSVDWWSSTHADMVNRYGDGSGGDLSTQTTFKCVRAAGFDDVTVVVELQ